MFILGGGHCFSARHQFVLDYLDGNLVRPGGACYLNWHGALPFLFLFSLRPGVWRSVRAD